MKSIRVGFLIAALVIASVVIAPAQSNQGRIVGRVTDATGAIVPRARVVILNSETGIKRELETNSAGEFVAPNLNPGLYVVSASSPTFKTTVRRDIRLEVASNLSIDLQLEPGAISETVQVTGEQAAIDTVTDTLGGTVSNKLINELPLQDGISRTCWSCGPGCSGLPAAVSTV
jgi:hypothetical protein